MTKSPVFNGCSIDVSLMMLDVGFVYGGLYAGFHAFVLHVESKLRSILRQDADLKMFGDPYVWCVMWGYRWTANAELVLGGGSIHDYR